MKEVSCIVFGGFLKELRKRRIPAEALVEGSPYGLDHIRNKRERVEWTAFLQIMANARRFWSSEQFVELGVAFLRNPLLRPLNLVARLLFSARDFYLWVFAAGSGAGNQMFTCLRPACRETGPNSIALELLLSDGYAPCPEFFLVAKGAFSAMPQVVGLGLSTVVMTPMENGAHYDIVYPSGGGALAWLRRAIAWPFSARAAARELKDAHELLQARYQELDEAKQVLALQAAQLSTAHSISKVVRGDLDLDPTIAAVARSLIEVGGFAAARIELAVDLEGRHVQRSVDEGTPPPGVEGMRFPLEGRGRPIGKIRLWPPKEADQTRLSELFQVVLPTISMAIDDALTYTALADYRTNLETKVADRTAELLQARDSLAQTVKRMEEAQAARDRLFANINHEIRTPLSLIMLAVADIKRREGHRLDERSQQELTTVELGVRRLLRLVDGLLLLAAGQEGKLRLRLSPFDVAVLLQLTASAWAPAAEVQGLSLTYSGPKRCKIVADEAAVERVVTNLISNAIKFTPRGGSVDVELVATADAVQIIVRDTGIGIDDEFKSRIFGRFEQGRPAVRPGARGSGIGLSLVKELIEAHEGNVAVESLRDGGSVFRVQLPLVAARAGSDEPEDAHDVPIDPRQRAVPQDFGLANRASDEPTVVEAPGTARATILVAEDEPELRRAIVELLRGEYRLILAPDGITALRLAQLHMPDLLLTDVGMPGMDGLELTRRFRELPGNRLAPTLLLTAYANLADRLSGFDAGAVDYILKPFEPEELRARIRSQLHLRTLALQLHQSEKLASLGTLTAGLAHELRNPASAVVNAIDPLIEHLPPDLLVPTAPVAQLLEVLRVCASQIALLSRQLLGFKRPGEFERQETSFQALLFRALSLVQPALRDVKLEQDLQYEGTISCAAPLVTQVLANLLENAGHAAGRGGWVRLCTRTEGERLVIEISDSGKGVPVELRERIFEPFFTTKPPGSGTGLGLTTARDIAVRHGGSLDVRDRPNGSLFRLEIPVIPPRLSPIPALETGAMS